MRRGFLAYLERERAHPYRPFLNYNTWYDIGYFSRFDAAAAIDVINAFGEELVVKREDADRFVPVGRRLGRPQDVCGSPTRVFPTASRRVRAAAKQVRRGAGLLAFALGRLRQAQARAAQVRPRARFRDRRRLVSPWPGRSTTSDFAGCASR